jgi:hypothetical protein
MTVYLSPAFEAKRNIELIANGSFFTESLNDARENLNDIHWREKFLVALATAVSLFAFSVLFGDKSIASVAVSTVSFLFVPILGLKLFLQLSGRLEKRVKDRFEDEVLAIKCIFNQAVLHYQEKIAEIEAVFDQDNSQDKYKAWKSESKEGGLIRSAFIIQSLDVPKSINSTYQEEFRKLQTASRVFYDQVTKLENQFCYTQSPYQ